MCGIAGIWRFGEPVTQADEGDIRKMTVALAHRGPDGEGYEVTRDLVLGHRRLAILDPSDHAAQPMSTPDGGGSLVYNGEVYNFREIRADLEREGVVFTSTGDAEVVLHALHRWGPEQAVPRFDGMFALAYHDHRSATLWLARDRLGIKPLSLARSRGRLIFASEDKALLAASGMEAEIDAAAMTLRLLRQTDANTSSLLNGIDRLHPGTMLRCRGADCAEIVYWAPLSAFDPHRLMSERRSDTEKIEALRALVERSVEMHLVADTPVAACLSGGVDSGLVSAIAARRLAGLSAYVADPDHGPNETGAAAATARMAGVRLDPVAITPESWLRKWPATLFALETPSEIAADPALLAIAERSRADGAPVLLNGEGADEMFGGYPWYKSAARRWSRAGPPWSWFRTKKNLARFRDRLATAPFAASIVSADPGVRAPGLEAAAPLATLTQTACARAVGALPSYRERGIVAAGLFDLTSHLQTLLNRQDRLGMAASVEIRVPFVENALIDFGMHLPGRDLLRGNKSKFLLKQVARAYLPRQNIDKRKLGFPMTLAYSSGTETLLRDGILRDVLSWTRRDLEAAMQHAQDARMARHRLVGAELFARLFVGGQSPGDLGEILVAMAREARTAGG